MLERIAHAKINLALHVTGQRSDGYHLLDSLVAFTEFGDVIAVKEADNASDLFSLTVDGPFSKGLEAGANNLVSRAVLALADKVSQSSGKPKPAAIKLTKNLPVASGIGGGSADAAATLLAVQEFWQTDFELDVIALELGADVPMCLHSKPLRAKGIGDELSLLEAKKPLHMVLINPNLEVSTPEIFKKLTNKNNSPISTKTIKDLPSVSGLEPMRNDLQNPALEVEPVIKEVLSALQETNADLVRMSGSGATCFAIYNNQQLAEAAVEQIKTNNPNWWCVASKTTVS